MRNPRQSLARPKRAGSEVMSAGEMRGDRDARLCSAVTCDDRLTASSFRPAVLRDGVDIEDPPRPEGGPHLRPGRIDGSAQLECDV